MRELSAGPSVLGHGGFRGWASGPRGDTPGHTSAAPPAQPRQGPGGAEYGHASFVQELVGDGAQACWIFRPSGAVTGAAPVVAFFHGWAGVNPANYGGWIVHLVRRGAIVLYPIYQTSLTASVGTMVGDACAGLRHALALLARRRLVSERPPSVFVGHSLGGWLAATCAACASSWHLPVPAALMLTQPGWGPRFAVEIDDLGAVGPHTLAVVLVGEDDLHVPEDQPRMLFDALSQVPLGSRNLILLRSDQHGTPPLIADHSAPLSERLDVGPRRRPGATWLREYAMRASGIRRVAADAHDFYGHWKLLDALIAAAFTGRDRDAALGNTARQRYMGTWSDGTPVKELVVLAGAGA
jgi:hypothetical protein